MAARLFSIKKTTGAMEGAPVKTIYQIGRVVYRADILRPLA